MTDILLLSLGLTLALELLYAWIWGVSRKDMGLVVWMNVLTNPLVVLWHYTMLSGGILINTVIPEILAVAAESMILRRFSKHTKHPIMFGISVNVFSFFTGCMINYMIFQ